MVPYTTDLNLTWLRSKQKSTDSYGTGKNQKFLSANCRMEKNYVIKEDLHGFNGTVSAQHFLMRDLDLDM